MAATFKNVICALGLFSLCFLGIPIRIDQPDSMEQEFKQFIEKHNKSYGRDPVEYGRRLSYFKASHSRAKEFNMKHNQNNGHASFGITKFSDLDANEFQEMLLRHKPSSLSCVIGSNLNHVNRNRRKREIPNAQKNFKPLPSYVDWREKNVVTAVKNQHSCGACWAFSTVQTVESMHAIATGELNELSTQQVIDCARNGNKGCIGGDTCTALTWMSASNVSLLEEKQYPLTLKDQRCRTVFEGSTSSGGVRLASNFTCYNLVDNEEQLKHILAFHGPVTAAVDAVTWQDYLGGIIQYHCRDHTNHAVQIVGYDTRGPIPYYIVRNSWGVDFGNQGYLQIATGKNLCGIAREVSALDVIVV
ncbi:cathepsin O-like [Daphnia pulex]|uniref:cathepsin O-like n=1 Tax=Daphnia pulex TaxID=6669 RepID=UPI001EDF0648|nr:cathepsin O-like [Daphnia pulex]